MTRGWDGDAPSLLVCWEEQIRPQVCQDTNKRRKEYGSRYCDTRKKKKDPEF